MHGPRYGRGVVDLPDLGLGPREAEFEVAEEILPLGVGRGPVLGGAQGAAAVDESPVGLDGLGGVDG